MIIEAIKEKNIVNISCGDDHVIALDSESCIYTWGDNFHGQLGTSNKSPSCNHGEVCEICILPDFLPRKVDLNQVVRISAGPDFSFALSKDINDDGQIVYNSFV